jgi:hypothetical protein
VKRFTRRRFGFLRKQLQLLAALALALLASDHVLPALHYALVAHELCPEHGVLEHVSGEVRERAHHENEQAFAQSSANADAHGHCDSVPASPPRSSSVATFDAAFVPATGVREPVSCVSPAVFAADVIAFAPKQSPPG